MLTSLKRNVLVFHEPVDMRKSFDGLFALIRKEEIFAGDIFLFIAKNRKRVKALFWDGTGLNIWMKRMEKGRFADIEKSRKITSSELKIFFEGSKLSVNKLSPDDSTHRYARSA